MGIGISQIGRPKNWPKTVVFEVITDIFAEYAIFALNSPKIDVLGSQQWECPIKNLINNNNNNVHGLV